MSRLEVWVTALALIAVVTAFACNDASALTAEENELMKQEYFAAGKEVIPYLLSLTENELIALLWRTNPRCASLRAMLKNYKGSITLEGARQAGMCEALNIIARKRGLKGDS